MRNNYIQIRLTNGFRTSPNVIIFGHCHPTKDLSTNVTFHNGINTGTYNHASCFFDTIQAGERIKLFAISFWFLYNGVDTGTYNRASQVSGELLQILYGE